MEVIGKKAPEDNRFKRPPLMWVEKNLERHPFFVPRGGAYHGNTILFHETVGLDDGREEECDWEVAGHAVLGLPKAFDQDLYMGVLRMLDEVGGPDDEGLLWFKIYPLLDFSGMRKDGRNYERAKDSIERIGSATIRTKNTLYSPRLGRRVRQQKFNIWDSDLIHHQGRRGSNLESNWIRFHEVFLESYREGYVDRLDSEFYRSLSKPVTKRWFRLLNEHCDEKGTWTVGVYRLRDLVPLSKNYTKPRDILKSVRLSGVELQERNYLEEFRVRGRGADTEISYQLAPHFGRRRLAERVALDPLGQYAINLMSSYRISREDAAELIKDHGAERCIEVSEQVPNQRKEVRNPGGWIKKGLKDEYIFQSVPPEKRRTGGRPTAMENSGKPRNFKEGYEWFFEQEHSSGLEEEAGPREKEVSGVGPETEHQQGTDSAAYWWSRLLETLTPKPPDERFNQVQPYTLVDAHLLLACEDREIYESLIDDYGERLGDLWRKESGKEEAQINIGSSSECDRVFEHLYGSEHDA